MTIPSAAYGSLKNVYPTLHSTPGEVTMIQSVLEAGHPLTAEDVFNSPYVSPRIAAKYSSRSLLGLPLIADGKKLGAALIGFNQPHRFTSDEIVHGEQAAEHLALAIVKSQLAVTDHLTNVYNRRGLYELGRREIDRTHRYGKPLSTIVLDIDHFKQINDLHGHTIGDQVLRAVADRFRKNIRTVDILGRYGGEEFAILLPESNLPAALQTAERLCRCIGDAPMQTEQGGIAVTISVGVASANASTTNLDILLNHADDAMYAAKQAGRNQVSVSEV
jgi:diguanylate cyclase (GGDEF)-like protein